MPYSQLIGAGLRVCFPWPSEVPLHTASTTTPWIWCLTAKLALQTFPQRLAGNDRYGSAWWLKKPLGLGGFVFGPNGQVLTSSREDDMQTGAGMELLCKTGWSDKWERANCPRNNRNSDHCSIWISAGEILEIQRELQHAELQEAKVEMEWSLAF